MLTPLCHTLPPCGQYSSALQMLTPSLSHPPSMWTVHLTSVEYDAPLCPNLPPCGQYTSALQMLTPSLSHPPSLWTVHLSSADVDPLSVPPSLYVDSTPQLCRCSPPLCPTLPPCGQYTSSLWMLTPLCHTLPPCGQYTSALQMLTPSLSHPPSMWTVHLSSADVDPLSVPPSLLVDSTPQLCRCLPPLCPTLPPCGQYTSALQMFTPSLSHPPSMWTVHIISVDAHPSLSHPPTMWTVHLSSADVDPLSVPSSLHVDSTPHLCGCSPLSVPPSLHVDSTPQLCRC